MWLPRWHGDAHAGRAETSLQLALAPQSVRLNRAEGQHDADRRPDARAAHLGGQGVSPNGVLGDPAGASAAEGESVLADLLADLLARVRAWCGDWAAQGPGHFPRHLGYLCLVLRGMNRERIKGHLDLLLLSVLAAGPAHGYAIISALRERSDGTFDLPEGTIYPALHRLEDGGLLSSSWAAGDGRRRRVYALTSAGATALAAEQTEWRRFATGVVAVLGWSM